MNFRISTWLIFGGSVNFSYRTGVRLIDVLLLVVRLIVVRGRRLTVVAWRLGRLEDVDFKADLTVFDLDRVVTAIMKVVYIIFLSKYVKMINPVLMY